MKRAALVAIWAGSVIALSFLVSRVAVLAQPPVSQEWPEQTPSALRGRAIYDARCKRCHGLQGAGDGEMVGQLPAPPPSFLDVEHMRAVTPAGFFDSITNGNMEALMPPWRDELSAQERWDVLFYVWSLGTTSEAIEAGEQVYAQVCAGCHGDAGDKVAVFDLSDPVKLAGWSQTDLASGIRQGHADVEWEDTLTDEGRWAVADYIRTFTYDTLFAVEAATGDGVIEGTVVGGTAGAQAELDSVELTLFPFVGQSTLTPITATAAADGSFRFQNLPTGADRTYGLQARYLGIDYFHPELISLSEEPSASITVQVYETTTDNSTIEVDRNHVIIDFANNRLQVAELYIFRNSGDRTYVGDGATLRFPLPDGARDVQFDDPRMNESTELEGNGIVDTLPVPPGTRQVLLSYRVPYSDRSMTFEKPIEYPTRNLNVLIADVGIEVDAGSLTAGEPVSTQSDVQFLNLTQREVPAGAQLSLKLSNLPQGNNSALASVPADQSGRLRWFGLAFVVLALAFVMAYPALRPRLLAEEALEADSTEEVLRRQRQMLLEELAELDEAYDAGEVAESTYVDTRAEIKADLIDIMQQLRELTAMASESQS